MTCGQPTETCRQRTHLERDTDIKVTDFGFSTEFTLGKKLEISCSTPAYAAPEIILGKKYQSLQSDMWNLGVMVYTLVSLLIGDI